MKVEIDLPDADVSALLSQALAARTEFPKFLESILRKHLNVTSAAYYGSKTFEEVFAIALENLKQLPKGQKFELPALLVRQGWESLSDGDRRRMGKLLKTEVESTGLATQERTSSNHTLYTPI